MRVLVLNGSPKGDKSNTYRLTSAFLDGLRQTQPVEAETIEVGKLHLLPCRGCFACWSKTPGKCVLQDDMAGVIEKILAADVLIWSFPLYYFSIPGQLKLLIDDVIVMHMADGLYWVSDLYGPRLLPWIEQHKGEADIHAKIIN